MSFIINNMKWIMLVSGGITFTVISVAIAPQLALSSMFGSSLEGPVAEVVVRSWGVVIALIGGMLIYGAFHTEVRKLVLTVASLSKLAFVSLAIIYGFAQQLTLVISLDTLMIVIFIMYLSSKRQN